MLAGFHTHYQLHRQTPQRRKDIIGKEVDPVISDSISSVTHWSSSSFFRESIILSLVANVFFFCK